MCPEEPEARLGESWESGFVDQAEEPRLWGVERFGTSVCTPLSCAGQKDTALALSEKA